MYNCIIPLLYHYASLQDHSTRGWLLYYTRACLGEAVTQSASVDISTRFPPPPASEARREAKVQSP